MKRDLAVARTSALDVVMFVAFVLLAIVVAGMTAQAAPSSISTRSVEESNESLGGSESAIAMPGIVG